MPRVKVHYTGLLLAMLLAVLISYSTVMCLADAFLLQANRLQLLAVCTAASLAAACSMLIPRLGVSALGAALVWAGLGFWMRQDLLASLWAVIYEVTASYAECYSGVAVLGQAGSSQPALMMLALPLCWITAWVICREGNALFLLLLCAPVLILCLIIVDIAPVLWLVVLSFALLVLLMSHSVRERNGKEGCRLAWWLILPAVILVTAITVLWPPADYTRADWAQELQQLAEEGLQPETLREMTETLVPDQTSWSRELRRVDLSRLGPKAMTGQAVLDSRMGRSRYYLRSLSLAVYEDNIWSAADGDGQSFSSQVVLPAQNALETDTLEISTLRKEELLYTAYYPAALPDSAVPVEDAYIKNGGGLRNYTILYRHDGAFTDPEYDTYVNQTYLQVPQQLREALQVVLAENGWDQTSSPEELAALVKNSAVYDLNTPRIPAGEDFVLYFLREGRRGYCVHFATATVMLLRTMGIPARYVTGYSVSGPAGQWVTVTEDDAHAWVEYYVNGTGWIPLDPTPLAGETEPVSPESQTGAQTQTSPVPEQPENVPEPEEQPQLQESAPSGTAARSGGNHWNWLWVLPAGVLVIVLRYVIGLHRKRDRCMRGHPNRRAMACWRWLVQLARKEGTSVEEELICLAEKARFSQHTLTEQELQQLQTALEQRIVRLKQYPAGKQIWFRFGLILY